MAFIVEDGTGLATANSYLALADANTYHTDRGNSTWTGTDAVKQAALVKATTYLDAHYTWSSGYKKSEAQALQWPRTGAFDRDGYNVENEVPPAVESACAELALLALSETLGAALGQSRKREKVDVLEVEYQDNSDARKRYPLVDGLLRGLVESFDTIRLVRS